jgi:ribonuclease Z
MKSRRLHAITLIGCGVVLGACLTGSEGLRSLAPSAQAQHAARPEGPPPDNMIDGTLYPQGRTPVPIKSGQYPREYIPNSELLGPDEMRVIALGTGMPNAVTKRQKACGWLVELGNGDKFIFDVGNGSKENLDAIRPDWQKLDKIFLSHLHIDHAGDVADVMIGGWMNGRYTPLHVYGPSGPRPKYGTKWFCDKTTEAWSWDLSGRQTGFPIGGGDLVPHEFDYKKVQVVYESNGARITSFPTIHVSDGPVGYRLDWNGRSFVFGGDSYPTKWFIEQARGVDLAIHECFFTPEAVSRLLGAPMAQAVYISSYIHTPPEAFGKIMAECRPRMAIGYHFWTLHDVLPEVQEGIRKTYDGPLSIAEDLMVWNVTDDQIVVRNVLVDENVIPTGTSMAYKMAPKRPASEAAKQISEFINSGKWEGYTPPPIPDSPVTSPGESS